MEHHLQIAALSMSGNTEVSLQLSLHRIPGGRTPFYIQSVSLRGMV